MVNQPPGTGPKKSRAAQALEKTWERLQEWKRGIHYETPKRYACVAYGALCYVWKRHPDANQILALATIALAAIGFYALRQTDQSVELSERAWIAPTGMKFDGPVEADKPISLSVIYSNPGRQPALDESHRAEGFAGPAPDAAKGWETLSVLPNTECDMIAPIEGGPIVFPSPQTLFQMNLVVAVTKPPLIDEAVKKGIRAFYVEGCFKYRTFGKPHKSGYCFFAYPDATKPMEQWGFRLCPARLSG